jgi:UDP-N-acetylglucosamine:LPS N-acetylglucosamine transferase
VGGGHLSAARALATELERAGCTTRLVDVYVECGRYPVTRFPALYALLARSHPRVWSLVYHATSRYLDASRALGPFLRTGLRRCLAQQSPQIVISVLPAVNDLLVETALGIGARVEVVLTDWHAVHRFWQAPGVDHYTAPTESARAECIRFGAPADAVDVVGIPVRAEFGRADLAGPGRLELLAALGLRPERFTVVAMVGAEGSPRAVRNLASLAQADMDAQLVVVCGHSRELRRQVEQLASHMPLRALGFVEDVASLMRAADLLVTKAGGLTLAEAFCCRLPVVVHDVLPGQEAGNLEYAEAHGAVAYAPTPERLVQLVHQLATDPARRAQLAERGASLARPDAARQIAANILARQAQWGSLSPPRPARPGGRAVWRRR